MSNKFTSFGQRMTPRLRTQLLLVSLTLLTIPWVGYKYLQEMEAFLRQGQVNSLISTANAIATVLHDRQELFQQHADIYRSVQDDRDLYARTLTGPVQLDGYTEDWKDYLSRAYRYAGDNVLESHADYEPGSLSFVHTVGKYGRYLYALFIVKDDHIVYRAPNSNRLDESDHLQIAMQHPDGRFDRYLLTTRAPGWVNAHLMPNEPEAAAPIAPEVRIKGEWQESPGGYTLEIRIPMSMIGTKLAFAIADVDDPVLRKINYVIGTAGTRRLEELGTVMIPSPEIEKILKGLERSASRIWVIDRHRRVLALSGSLQTIPSESGENNNNGQSVFTNLLRTLYGLVLRQPASEFEDDLSGASHLDGQEINRALAGTPDARWRASPDQRAVILSAAYPVWGNDETLGAVVVEQTSNTILTLQNRAMENLLNVTLVAFLAVTLFLLAYATRLSTRIRKLRDETDAAISSDGRVTGEVISSGANDEIGDLSRSVADMLSRLSGYTKYLETMAAKLSHELRTPLTVVKSSLENLDQESLNHEACTYTGRAKEGVHRLNAIITSLSEATRLEQALQQADQEDFDIGKVVGGCIEGYRIAYPDQVFELESRNESMIIHGVPELIAQMMDKLVSNAIDFCTPSSPITITISKTDNRVCISVENQGPSLPDEMTGQLFDSMVSIRSQRSDEHHLGLGLYIVRLIAEFHGGRVEAVNRADIQGVMFNVIFPFNAD